MADPPGMHKLNYDFTSLFMDFRSNFFPTFNLFFTEYTWYACIAKSVRRRGSAFSNDEPCCRTLSVVFSNKVVGDISYGSAARHWRHRDAILYFNGSDLSRGK